MSNNDILVDLPGSRLYSEPCYSKTFTFGDISSIGAFSLNNDTSHLYKIIGSKINLPVEDLLLQDFLFLLYWHRINSYPSFPNNITWTCPECYTKQTREVLSSDYLIDELLDDYEHTGVEYEFEKEGPLLLRLKTVKDDLVVSKYMKDHKIPEKNVSEREALFTACMLEPNGGTLEERKKLVERMTSDDFFTVKSFEADYDYGIQSYYEFTCVNEQCKEVVTVPQNSDLTTFFPDIQRRRHSGNKVFSRKRVKSTNKLNGSDKSGGSVVSTEATSAVPQDAKHEEQVNTTKKENNKLEITPEELQAMILKGIQEANQNSGDEGYGKIDDLL